MEVCLPEPLPLSSPHNSRGVRHSSCEYLTSTSNKQRKQDWYIWDPSCLAINNRKVILSVWDGLRNEFNPKPGTIVALSGVKVNNDYDEDPNWPLRMTRIPNPGHLNAYSSNRSETDTSWFAIDPKQAVGYEELKEAWEEHQYLIDWDEDIFSRVTNETFGIGW